MLNDVIVYAVGDYEENEVLLANFLNTIYETINYFTKYKIIILKNFEYIISKYLHREKISKKSILENFENIILAVDEIIDEG